MNYYIRHLGDYARDTRHLSMLEHGAYSMLLDRYYSTECPIPAGQVYRFSVARTPEEKAAVDAVLDEFFVLNDDSAWAHSKCDAEIQKAMDKINSAKENGKRGGRPIKSSLKNTGTATQTRPESNPTITQEKPTGLFSVSDLETQTEPEPNPDESSPLLHYSITPLKTLPSEGNINLIIPPAPEAVVCARLKFECGFLDVNPSHPKLLKIIKLGATVEEIVNTGFEAKSKGKGFAWLLAAIEGRLNDSLVAPIRASPGKHSGFDRIDYNTGINADGTF